VIGIRCISTPRQTREAGTRRFVALALGLALVLLVLAFGVACSAIKVSQYDSGRRISVHRVAVVPLLVLGATETQVQLSGSYVMGWFRERSQLTSLSPAQYQPAGQTMFDYMREALSGKEVIAPEQVNQAMAGVKTGSLQEAAQQVAARTQSQAVLVFRIRDFNTRPAGIDNARATGVVDVTLYDPKGAVLWAVSGNVNYSGVGDGSSAPELVDFVDYAASEMQGEIEDLLRG
jgi:hypothetical protein